MRAPIVWTAAPTTIAATLERVDHGVLRQRGNVGTPSEIALARSSDAVLHAVHQDVLKVKR
jgi:hypothetical protein